jgi:quinoprotein glucose dehydrogenase
MIRRSTLRRASVALGATGAALALAASTVSAQAAKAAPMARGNAYGEWRHWGADQWSTRYSPLDQINADNFSKLQVSWEWKGGEKFGPDEYYRTTPLYANGRLFTVTSTKRHVVAIDPETGKELWSYRVEEGIRWQKAPRQFAGRGLAYWNSGRSTRRRASPIRSSARRAKSISWKALAIP